MVFIYNKDLCSLRERACYYLKIKSQISFVVNSPVYALLSSINSIL